MHFVILSSLGSSVCLHLVEPSSTYHSCFHFDELVLVTPSSSCVTSGLWLHIAKPCIKLLTLMMNHLKQTPNDEPLYQSKCCGKKERKIYIYICSHQTLPICLNLPLTTDQLTISSNICWSQCKLLHNPCVYSFILWQRLALHYCILHTLSYLFITFKPYLETLQLFCMCTKSNSTCNFIVFHISWW